MSALNRELSPISKKAWKAIDDEATTILKVVLAGRKLVDLIGPLGWTTSAVDLGRVEGVNCGPKGGVNLYKRRVLPMIEIRREFEVSLSEIEAIDRGAEDADLDTIAQAARAIAVAEDNAIFNGLPDLDVNGILPAATHTALTINENYENYPELVARAVSSLRTAGVEGPYTIALGPRCFIGLNETTVNGFPVLNHVAELLDVAPVSAPAIDGAVVLTTRGGDFELHIGRDFAIGYREHDSKVVRLFIDESFTFRTVGAEAAVPLAHTKKARRRS